MAAAGDSEQSAQSSRRRGDTESEETRRLHRRAAKSRSYRQAMATPTEPTPESVVNHDEAPSTSQSRMSQFTSSADHCSEVNMWTEASMNGRHLWMDTDVSGNSCYMTDCDCLKSGPRKKCAACKIIVHSKCIEQLDRKNFKCKLTFRELHPKGSHESNVRHHWVLRRKQEGKCHHCGKSFQHMLSFQNKDIIAISCSWCKAAYHNKDDCFKVQNFDEFCDLGTHANLIVPPSWVVKIPPRKLYVYEHMSKTVQTRQKQYGLNPITTNGKGYWYLASINKRIKIRAAFNDRVRTASMKRNSFKKRSLKRKSTKSVTASNDSGDDDDDDSDGSEVGFILDLDAQCDTERKPFVIKPSGSAQRKPLLVFINPRSGGNQGAKIMHKFQWLLNPRQVFDLSRGGPREGLELYRKVPNLRILACGGDGTVGWVLSELDKQKITPPPPVAVLPLGTGNDLSRVLNWGGGYTDEPLSKILMHIDESSVVQLDRWNLEVTTNQKGEIDCSDDAVKTLPLNVMNNYFSLGFDAEVCLEFHESREANPDKFNSRFKNLVFYGKASSATFLQRKARDFFKFTTLECDGVDLTDRLQETKPLCLLFVNIPSYSAGTSPWGHPGRGDREFQPQRLDDGYLEVIGLTSATLATTRVGGHGERIAQCKEAIIVTSKSVSMQVDGEPCRLFPSRIRISRRNQANMLQKVKRRTIGSTSSSGPIPCPEPVKLQLYCVGFKEYEKHCYDLTQLRETSTHLATTTVEPDCDLEQMRAWVERFKEEEEDEKTQLSNEWCFLDTTYPDRVYRVDVAQEKIYNVVDILEDGIFIVDLSEDTFTAKNNNNTSSTTTPPRLKRPLSSSPGFQFARSSSRPSVDLASRQKTDSSQSSPSDSVEDIVETTVMTPFTNREFKMPSPEGDEPDTIWVRNEILNRSDYAMIEASKTGELEKVMELHRSGVSLSAGDHRGWRPLHYAARHGHKEVVRYIISNVPRCVLDLVEEEKGQTALHKAALYERRTICSLLVQAGASLTRTDYDGNTPRIQALKAQDKELAKYLETQEHLQIIAAEDYETAV